MIGQFLPILCKRS